MLPGRPDSPAAAATSSALFILAPARSGSEPKTSMKVRYRTGLFFLMSNESSLIAYVTAGHNTAVIHLAVGFFGRGGHNLTLRFTTVTD